MVGILNDPATQREFLDPDKDRGSGKLAIAPFPTRGITQAMRNFLLLIVLSCAASVSPYCQADDENSQSWQVPVLLGKDGWMTYQNGRFGFSLPVPPAMKAERPPENGSGQSFTSADGKVSLSAWAHFNTDGLGSVDAAYKEELSVPDRTITYKRKTDGWFVVSGVNKDGSGFYMKYAANAKYFAGFSINYPQAEEKQYQPWIERIAKDFQPRLGKGADTIEDAGERKGKKK